MTDHTVPDGRPKADHRNGARIDPHWDWRTGARRAHADVARGDSAMRWDEKVRLVARLAMAIAVLLGPATLRAEDPVATAADPRDIRTGHPIPDEGYCDQPYVVVTDDGHWL